MRNIGIGVVAKEIENELSDDTYQLAMYDTRTHELLCHVYGSDPEEAAERAEIIKISVEEFNDRY